MQRKQYIDFSWAVFQMNAVVGAVTENAQRIISASKEAHEKGADWLLTPEMSLCGYPAEDLWLDESFVDQCHSALEKIAEEVAIPTLVGHPCKEGGKLFNSVSLLFQGKVLACYHKWSLPNFSVFDEKRYFVSGDQACVVDAGPYRVMFLICEDVWSERVLNQMTNESADLVVVLNASPFDQGKIVERQTFVKKACERLNQSILYVNSVGGQDELVFDGGSFAMQKDGQVMWQMPWFSESLAVFNGAHHDSDNDEMLPIPNRIEALCQALSLGLKDYLRKNGIPKVWLGLSGGIDSAVTLAICVEVLGAENVSAVMMPSLYTAEISVADARLMAQGLGVKLVELPIDPVKQAVAETLKQTFEGRAEDVTEENIQARIRGVLLMALANKWGGVVINTSNKSELATGYGTLYGDMVGGFALLKDVYKCDVYALARYLNRDHEVIPSRIITRPPSAELRPDQTDQDNLPSYEILDAVLYHHLEEGMSQQALMAMAKTSEWQAKGWNDAIIAKVFRLLDFNEYKRRQAVVGVRVSKQAFGRDRRVPMTHRFRFHQHS